MAWLYIINLFTELGANYQWMALHVPNYINYYALFLTWKQSRLIFTTSYFVINNRHCQIWWNVTFNTIFNNILKWTHSLLWNIIKLQKEFFEYYYTVIYGFCLSITISTLTICLGIWHTYDICISYNTGKAWVPLL